MLVKDFIKLLQEKTDTENDELECAEAEKGLEFPVAGITVISANLPHKIWYIYNTEEKVNYDF